MSIYKKILVTFILLANASVALAQIYRCDGPEGPVYSDKEREPNAATVDVLESSGLTGISEDDKAVLAEKKTARDQAEKRNRTNDDALMVNQNDTLTTQNNGRWVRGRDQIKHRAVTNIFL